MASSRLSEEMYVILAKIHHSRLEPYVLIDNPNYNPSFRVGRFSGRPVSSGPSDFSSSLASDMRLNGQRNPICVWEVSGKYYVAYGSARVRAARSVAGLEFLDAIISGPGTVPVTIEPTKQYDLTTGDWHQDAFRDPPLHFRIEPEGFLYFDGCVSGFDEIHNPEGAKALRNRGPGVNNGLLSVRSEVPVVQAGGPASPLQPPTEAVAHSNPPGVNVHIDVASSGVERSVLSARVGQRGSKGSRKSA